MNIGEIMNIEKIGIYNDDGVLVAESDDKLSLSVQELLEGNGYSIKYTDSVNDTDYIKENILWMK